MLVRALYSTHPSPLPCMSEPAEDGRSHHVIPHHHNPISAYRGNVSAPGIFLDPCPTGDLLGGALRGRT